MNNEINRTDTNLLATYNGHPVPNRCFSDEVRREGNKLVAVSKPCPNLKSDGKCNLQKCNKIIE